MASTEKKTKKPLEKELTTTKLVFYLLVLITVVGAMALGIRGDNYANQLASKSQEYNALNQTIKSIPTYNSGYDKGFLNGMTFGIVNGYDVGREYNFTRGSGYFTADYRNTSGIKIRIQINANGTIGKIGTCATWLACGYADGCC